MFKESEHRRILNIGLRLNRVLEETADQGAFKRLARGICTPPLDGRNARTRSPSLEIAGHDQRNAHTVV
jgi:hypothetical protein